MKEKILVVDDSSTARALLRLCFSAHSEYEIIQASHWSEAVKMALLHNPSLILLDYNMPEKSGAELAQLIQETGIKAQYVLITANTQQAVIDEVKKLGFFDVIEKPVSAENIQSLLERLK